MSLSRDNLADELRAQREVMITRFDANDKRFEETRVQSDARFQHVDRHLRVHEWLIGGGMVLLATIMTLYQFLG